MRPFFSIIVPTRNRAKTLYYSLQTALFQDFSDYEVIVSDNASTDATAAVVAQVGGSRVRYVRTPELLPMAKNWEFGIGQARGRYVLVLSDDDGLLRHTLSTAHEVIANEGAEVLMWHRAIYAWPQFPLKAQHLWPGVSLKVRRNCLICAVPRYRGGFVRAPDVLSSAVRHVEGNGVPTLVNSVVSVDVLQRLRERAGCLFLSYAPDTSSGFAIPCVVDRFYELGKIVSVAGLSEFSTGTALEMKGESSVEDEFRRLNRSVKEFDSTFMEMFAGSTAGVILDSIHAAAKHFPGRIPLQEIDLRDAYAQSIVEYAVLEDRRLRGRLIRRLYRMALESHGPSGLAAVVGRVTRRRMARVVNTPSLRAVSAVARRVLRRSHGSWRYFSGDRYGFSNILEVCEFVGGHVEGPSPGRVASTAAPPYSVTGELE